MFLNAVILRWIRIYGNVYSVRGRDLCNSSPVIRDITAMTDQELGEIKLTEKMRVYRYAGRLFNRKLFPH